MSEPLWITEPSRRTCLADVTEVRGSWFSVDRSLFAPGRSRFRHPQPADKGTIWREGEKRKLAGVRSDGWLRLRDVVPDVGETLQCELDQAWRGQMDAAHTAMHLFIAASDAAMVCDPEVKGGGHARITFGETIAPHRLKQWLGRAQTWIDQDIPIASRFEPRSVATLQVSPQSFQPPDAVPAGDPVPLVEIPGACCLPCDGTHVDRTGRIDGLVVSHAAWGKLGFVVGIRAATR